jgi:hypothetical protein
MGDGVAKIVNRLRDAKESGKLGKQCLFFWGIQIQCQLDV